MLTNLLTNRSDLDRPDGWTPGRCPRSARGHAAGSWLTRNRWEKQLGLSLLGMAAVFAWEKALGNEPELAWWERVALDGARWL